MIVTRTPLRISFAGGGTDLPSFYRSNTYGLVLNTSINKYIYVTVKKHPRVFTREKFRLSYSETELVENLEKIKNPIIRECIKFLKIEERLYISTISDIPASTGLGSSSTFCVGLLKALYAFKKKRVGPKQLSEEAFYIERDVLKRPVGKQDHYAAAFGGLNYIRFNDDESTNVKSINLSKKNKKYLENSMAIFCTGIQRLSWKILHNQNARHLENVIALNIIKNQAIELKRLFEKKKISIDKIGNLINEGWETKKTLSKNISNKFIDNAFEKAFQSGAYGGRICGAGGGGFVLFITSPKYHKKLIKNMKKIGLTKFDLSFGNKGSMILINLQ